jgi:hypothetical protein
MSQPYSSRFSGPRGWTPLDHARRGMRPAVNGIGSRFDTTPLPAEFGGSLSPSEPRPAGVRLPVPASAAPATEKQLSFLRTLAAEREIPDDAREALLARIERKDITKSRASDFITRLCDKPKVSGSFPADVVRPSQQREFDLPDVPEGRYAIKEADDVTRFYRIDKPTEGRWAGRVFVSIQASDELHPVRDPRRRYDIISNIALDPAAATRLYGREIGSCGVCGRTLTDETSREYGIGPVCREKTGW